MIRIIGIAAYLLMCHQASIIGTQKEIITDPGFFLLALLIMTTGLSVMMGVIGVNENQTLQPRKEGNKKR